MFSFYYGVIFYVIIHQFWFMLQWDTTIKYAYNTLKTAPKPMYDRLIWIWAIWQVNL